MKVYLGADHAGYELKNQVREHLQHQGHEVEDCGALTLDPKDDYPQYAFEVATKVLGEDGSFGVLVCGSGEGMAMAANRVNGIRAALVWSQELARKTRQHNNANVLCLPAEYIDTDTAFAITDNFLEEKFSDEERHQRRIDQVDDLG